MRSEDAVCALGVTNIIVPPGLTLGVLVSPMPGQVAALLKNNVGSTLQVIGVAAGSTLTAAQLSTANGYFLGASEIFQIDGPASFYIATATGTTHVASLVAGKSAGT